MDVQLSENQVKCVRKIAEKEGFCDFELKATPGSSKGDNYMGVITTVSIKNHQKKLDLILKSALTSEELRKRTPVKKVFLREMYLYDTIFPEFKKFERAEGFNEGFSSHPKMYGGCDEDRSEFLVLENMKEAGYELWNRKVPMNEDHVALVCKEYGKFHAVSFAMQDKRPDLFQELCGTLNNVFEDMGTPEEFSEVIKTNLAQGFEALKGDQFATDALERFSSVIYKFLLEDLKIRDERSVVLHGDCWCNNMLFKYENPEEKKPSQVCLIDWQLSWLGSPALDLSYFLFTCAPKRILADYKKYLKIYHDRLSNTLKELNCDPETLFPFALLENHWQKYAKYGIYIALILVKLMLSDGNEVPDMSEIADSGKSFAEGFTFETVHNETYNGRVRDMITVSGENNWI